MIVRLIFKTPDVMDSIAQDIKYQLPEDVSEEDYDVAFNKMKDFIHRYTKWSELITVEFDDETEIVTVVPN